MLSMERQEEVLEEQEKAKAGLDLANTLLALAFIIVSLLITSACGITVNVILFLSHPPIIRIR